MQLKKIEILKYKSINTPATINFNCGEPVTLIGKNGSGKTNILEALKLSFSNGRYFPNHKNQTVLSTYYFILSAEDKNKYFKDIELNEEDSLIKVNFDGKEPTVRLISSPAVKIRVKKFREEAALILEKFKTAAKIYVDNLKKIEIQEASNFMIYLQVDCQNDRGNLTYLESFLVNETQRRINEQLKSIQNILDTFKYDNFKLNDFNYSSFRSNFNSIELYTIANSELKISPIIAKSLGITKKKLEEANLELNNNIKRINSNLKDSYNALVEQIDKFNKLTDKIKATFCKADDNCYDIQEKKEATHALFMQDLKNAVFKNCYYIDNENTLLFSPSPDNQYSRHQASIENFRTQNPLLEAFHNFLLSKKAYDGEESILEYTKLEQNRRKKFIELINDEFLANYIPNFEKNEIKGLLLKEESNQLNLFIKENNDAEINVNETSLGRRWYLTYRLVKSIIKPRDILLIDEPAAFLHPQAQQEIKKELDQLAKSGIFVIYTTHSPYMIPANWGQIYNVKNTQNGTEIISFASDDELSTAIKEELGITQSADILFKLDKTLLLVEGIADKTCVEKFAELLNYDLSDFELLPCNGSPILDITHLCIHKNIRFKALLDRDNLSKPQTWLAHKFGYKEYLETIKSNTNCVFTPEIRSGKSLEDCFTENDNKRYFFDYKYHDNKTDKDITIRKISHEKIAAGTQFDTETMNNFEQLFIKLEILPLDKTK